MGISLPPVVADVLRAVAPTLLAGISLTGPLGAAVAGVASLALKAWLPPEKQIDLTVNGAQATQPEVIRTIQENASNPSFLRDLKRAELDAQQLEAEMGLKFAQLEQKDRSDARAMARDSGTTSLMFRWGMGLVGMSLVVMLAVVAGVVAIIAGAVHLDPNNASLAVAGFTLVGAIVGNVNGYGMAVIQFFFGSSQSSKDKTDQITSTMRDLGSALGDAAKAAPAAPVVVTPVPAAIPQPDAGAVPDAEKNIDWKQGPYGGVRFRIDENGYVVVEGEDKPGRTVGEPATVRRIWRDYGPIIATSCSRNGLPLEIAVACIATESRGQAAAMLTEPDGRQSLGLMQVLTSTASEVVGREVDPRELLAPEFGIEVGVRFMAQQRKLTAYLPPFAAAAYNSGGLHPPRPQDDNRWRLRSTGDHIDRFVWYFNDAVFVAKADQWSH